MAKKAKKAAAPPQKIIKRSVQQEPLSLEQGPGGGNSFVMWMASVADTFIPWGTDVAGRDVQLRDWWHTETVLAGAIFTIVSANAGFKWELDGPEETTKVVQEMLQNANMGKGWRNLVQKFSLDFYTQDNAGILEIIRSTNSPNAPVMGVASLESHRCTRTGDYEFPIIYLDRHGTRHKMPWYSVVPLEEFPSPIEEMHDVQFCAVTRVLRAAQIMRDIAIYKGEKIGGRFSEAIHVIGGVKQSDIEDVRNRQKEQADNAGLARYLEPLIITSLDPQTSVSSVTINFKSLPESFDLDSELKWYISMIALGTGRDYQDFAPLPGGGLGTSTQSQTLHLKSRGKGPATFMETFAHAMNSFVMPRTVTFRFSEQDIEAEKQEAEVKLLRAEERATRIDSGELDPMLARQIAQDQGDLDMRYLALMGEENLTPEMLVQQGEKPEDEDEPTRMEDEKVYIMPPEMEIEAYVGGLKGVIQRAMSKVRRDTEESEAIQALRVAAGSLADSAAQSKDIHVHKPQVKIQAPEPQQVQPEIHVKVIVPESDEESEVMERDAEGRILKIRKKKVRTKKPEVDVEVPSLKAMQPEVKVEIVIPESDEETEVTERDGEGRIKKIRKKKIRK